MLTTDNEIQTEQITEEEQMEQSFPKKSVHETLVWNGVFKLLFGLGFAHGSEMWQSGCDWQVWCLKGTARDLEISRGREDTENSVRSKKGQERGTKS